MAVIKVEDVAYVRFQAPDLQLMRAFLEDFGLSCSETDSVLYGAATDGWPFAHVTEPGDAGFTGLGFRARSQADLELLAAREGVSVASAQTPGGGHIVRLTDPDGLAVDVVAGQTRGHARPLAAEQPVNSLSAQRRLSKAFQLEPAPAHTHRLGHAMIMVRDFASSVAWYQDRLGLIMSDRIEDGTTGPIGAFLRVDNGNVPTDHHTLALIATPDGPGFGHAAFEVEGFDDLMKGHSYLKDRRHDHAWGVGRHMLGSQIFDYWKDPWGHELEHWTDGDLHVASDPTGVRSVEEALGTHWGPRHPLLTGKN